MSNIAIKGATTGTGTFTIESPATNTDRTLTLPDEAGTVLTSGGAIDVNASAPADSLAINASGNVGIATTSPASPLHVYGGHNGLSAIIVDDTGVGGGRQWGIRPGLPGVNNGYLTIHDETANATRLSISDTGNLVLGTGTTGGDMVKLNNTTSSGWLVNFNNSNATNKILISSQSGTGAVIHHQFNNSNGLVGKIETSGSSTTYATSSDYRLKENVVDMTGAIDRFKALKPSQFNFIADPDDTTVDGFLAHEVQTVVPEAVTGTHNEVDDEGNPVYQGIDQSKLVPLLTGALQEAIARIETLEAEVATLKGASA